MNIPVQHKNLKEIAHEWDAVCQDRANIILNEHDYSLIGVTVPAILNKLETTAHSKNNLKIIDVGCGTGFLTHALSKSFSNVVGIDISAKSIDISANIYSADNLKFYVSSIQDFAFSESFDFCTANMVFMTDPNMRDSLRAIYGMLSPTGILVFTVTHPCFWPKYWNYETEAWFQYNKEIYIESDFTTSLSDVIGKTTHIHRPIEQYCRIINDSGFVIDEVLEPYPTGIPPQNYKYPYPRFLLFSCKKSFINT